MDKRNKILQNAVYKRPILGQKTHRLNVSGWKNTLHAKSRDKNVTIA